MIALVSWKDAKPEHAASKPKGLPDVVHLPLSVEADYVMSGYSKGAAKYYLERTYKWPTAAFNIEEREDWG